MFDTLGLSPEAAQFTALAIAFSLISFLHIVLGELAPKSMAIRRPERMSLWTAAPLYAFYWVMYPAIWVLNNSANRLLRVLGWGEVEHQSHRYSREELKLIVGRQDPNAAAPDHGMALMSHVLELPDLVAGDLMRPREHLRSLREGMTLQTVLAEFSTSRYSRYPWFDADGEQVLGILHTKDILVAMARGQTLDALRTLLRPATVLALESPIPRALEQFRSGAPILRCAWTSTAASWASSPWRTCWRWWWARSRTSTATWCATHRCAARTARCWWPAAPRSFAWNACWAGISARPTRSIRLAA